MTHGTRFLAEGTIVAVYRFGHPVMIKPVVMLIFIACVVTAISYAFSHFLYTAVCSVVLIIPILKMKKRRL